MLQRRQRHGRFSSDSVSTAVKNLPVILVVHTELLTCAVEEPGNFSVHLSKRLQFEAGEALKKYQAARDHSYGVCGRVVYNRWGQGMGLTSVITSVLTFPRKAIDLARFKKWSWPLVL